MVQQDIDRLAELLQSGSAVAQSQALSQQGAPQQAADQRTVDAPTFLSTMSDMFHTRTITALDQQEITIAADRRSASFLGGGEYDQLCGPRAADAAHANYAAADAGDGW